jgi:hypothetical protein
MLQKVEEAPKGRKNARDRKRYGALLLTLNITFRDTTAFFKICEG